MTKLSLLVETYILDSKGEPLVLEASKVIDHNKSSDRQWLGKHCFWAFRNQRGIQTRPVL